MAEQPKAKGTDYGGQGNRHDRFLENPSSVEPPPITLGEAGIDKNLAHRARNIGPSPVF